MQLIRRVFPFLFLGLAMGGCFDEPKYPDKPQITFRDIVFRPTPEISDADTLTLFIDFKDGDGDLGLNANDPNDLSDPYNNSTFYQEDGNGGIVPVQTIEIGEYTVLETDEDKGPLVTYRTRSEPGYSSVLPVLDPEKVGCVNYLNSPIVVPHKSSLVEPSHITDTLQDQFGQRYYQILDTLYFTPNDNHYNITVQFLVLDNSGNFTEFDWRDKLCTTFDGRFPILADDNSGSPLEGTIRYDMKSVGFLPLFGNKRMKLRFSIKDRALNKSNVVETPEFTLAKIRK